MRVPSRKKRVSVLITRVVCPSSLDLSASSSSLPSTFFPRSSSRHSAVQCRSSSADSSLRARDLHRIAYGVGELDENVHIVHIGQSSQRCPVWRCSPPWPMRGYEDGTTIIVHHLSDCKHNASRWAGIDWKLLTL